MNQKGIVDYVRTYAKSFVWTSKSVSEVSYYYGRVYSCSTVVVLGRKDEILKQDEEQYLKK